MLLSEIPIHHKCIIKDIKTQSLLKERLMAIGFVKNATLEVIRKSTKNHLAVYLISGSMFALRKEEAMLIEVEPWV